MTDDRDATNTERGREDRALVSFTVLVSLAAIIATLLTSF